MSTSCGWEGKGRYGSLIPLADETQGVQVKLCYPLTMRAIPERVRDASCGGALPFTFITVIIIVIINYYQSRISGVIPVASPRRTAHLHRSAGDVPLSKSHLLQDRPISSHDSENDPTSCRRAAATICPRPGLQRKRAAAALSQADRAGPGRAGPDQPIRAIQPAIIRRPPTGCTRLRDRRQTDRRQTASSLNAPWARA